MDEKTFAVVYGDMEKKIEGVLFKVEKNAPVRENAEALRGFLSSLQADGVSAHRRYTYASRVGKVAKLLPVSFKEATRKDLETIVSKLRKTEKAWSIHTQASCLRAFYRSLFKLDAEDKLPESVRWFKPKKPPSSLRSEDLFTEEELGRLMAAAQTLSWKTLISVAFESAARPGELLGIRLNDLVFNGSTIKLYLSGKLRNKEGERTVYLVRSYALLKQLADSLKTKDDLLFTTKRGLPMSSSLYTNTLKQIAKRAGIKRKINPYRFRHTTATALYRDLGEQLAKKYLGHSPDSKMARTYVHLNDDDLELAIQRKNGLLEREEKKETGKCPHCGRPSYYGEKLCRCGTPLTTGEAIRIDELQAEAARLLADPDVLAGLRELKNKG